MADNGAVEFIPPVNNRLDPQSSFDHLMRNYPLRGGKWTLYEGGIRVPFMIRGPGIKAGTQTDVPAIGWDILPTINELVGNKNKPIPNIDGGSLVNLIKNQGQGKVDRPSSDLYFHRYNNGYPHSAIISGEYKLIKFWKTKKLELYHLKEDLGEIKDLSKQQPELVKQLEAKLLKYMESVNPEITKRYL
jgi:arylsulfatase A-like enzyme